MSIRAFLLVVAAFSAAPVAGQTVVGRVAAETDARPLSGVSIALHLRTGEVQARSITDAAGRYAVRAPESGEYTVVADFLGYRRLESPLMRVEEGATISVDFELPADPIELEGLEVEVERQRRVRRRVAQYGVDIRQMGQRFVPRGEITRRETASNFGQVLQWQNVAGMSVSWSDFPPSVCVRLGRGRQGCALLVLDGQIVSAEHAYSVPPQLLETIVVLTPTEATLSFGTDATNGAVLLFTRANVRTP